ncbi:hypothetical protein R1sor_003266 [Riccia sorocarpa]|uniref:DUF4378 domain-containing protein n=1 Tax=Riccia sorocarpa TaxID=122646 RepID=A0ABD3H3X4_9MARC
MEYIREERNRHSGYEVRAESPRTQYFLKEPQRVPYDFAGTPRSSSANGRSTGDGRDLTRSSLDIKDIVRAQFLRERARASVDKDIVHQSSAELRERESPRFASLKYKEPSLDTREVARPETPRSASSPRLSIRLKEAVRAAVESSKGKHVRSSSESSDVGAGKPRETTRTAAESRLLVELRESPRLTRDAPRYSCDGRDVLRLSVDSSKDTLRAAAQRARESPRLSVDGRASPRLPRSDIIANGQLQGPTVSNSGHLQSVCLESDGRDSCAADQRRRVPSLVARLMGLEDLPHDQTLSRPTTPPKKPSKESKILKSLLQYTPVPEPKPAVECRQADLQNVDFYYKPRSSGSSYEYPEVYPPAGSQADWNPVPETLGHLRLSSKQLGMESVPSSRKETRDIGSLRHEEGTQGVPRQLTEAVLTVLKHSDGKRRVPMSYAEMENRLRQLRLRSSYQDHKSLMQILEAMQTKGLLSGPRSRESSEESRESRQQLDSRQQTTPRHITLPKLQESSSEAMKVKNLQELRKLGSKLQDQQGVGSNAADGAKILRQSQSVSKTVTVEQEPQPEASIVVMKPIGKPVKKSRSQNPAMLLESMPPKGGKESPGKSSPWGSPVNRPSRSQPGYGFGREPTNRFNAEEALSSKRRERMIARNAREVQPEPSAPRSPRLITVPQSSGKLRSSGSRDAPEKPSSKLVSGSSVSRVAESGRRPRSTSAVPKEKEESSKLLANSLRSHSSRDLLGLRKGAVEPEVVQTRVLRRSNSDGKIQFPVDKERNSGSPPETSSHHRSRSSSSKSRGSLSDTEAPSTPIKRKPVTSGSKSSGSGDRSKEKSSSTPGTPGCTTPRSIARNIAADFSKKKEEQSCVVAESLQQVRVTEGDATDQSGARTPLVGLTNRLQNMEFVDLDQKDNQGLRTPRGAIIVKKTLPQQEDSNLVSDIIDVTIDQSQPSPISVLDGAVFQEEDFSPLQLSKCLNADVDLCLSGESAFSEAVGQGETVLQERVNHAAPEVVTPVAENSDKYTSKESCKVVPARGEDKIIGLQETEERSYVRDVLLVSGATMGIKAVNPAGNPIDSTVYDYLDEKKGIAEYGWEKNPDGICDSVKWEGMKARQAMDRRMLFDTVNDILTTMLVPYVNVKPWMQALVLPPLRKRPTGQKLVQAVWDELQALPPQEPCDDICESLYLVLQKDLTLAANAWISFSEEVEEIGLEIEKMIYQELLDEVVCCLSLSYMG